MADQTVISFPNYLVNEFGDVINKTTGKRLKPLIRGPYLYYELYNGSVRRKFSVHRLVATAFIPNPENKPQVNHIDSNPHNNCVSNLEWVTSSENNLHANRHGNKGVVKSNEGNFGKDSFSSRGVRVFFDSGEVKEFGSAKEASTSLNISYRNLTEAARLTRYMPRKKLTVNYMI